MIRPSGTESKIKIYIGCSGLDKAQSDNKLKSIVSEINNVFNREN